MSPARRLTQCAAVAFLAAGLWGVAHIAYAVGSTRSFQSEARAALIADVRAPVPAPAPARPAREGDVLGQIYSERIGLTAVIAEGESVDVLKMAVGHLADTPAPGESGNVVLAGHRDTFFRPLRYIDIGDVITVITPAGAVHYEVEWTRVVPPDELAVIDPTAGRRLTLITCHPFAFIGAAPNRFIVRARELGSPAD